jgi:hypothetical protein
MVFLRKKNGLTNVIFYFKENCKHDFFMSFFNDFAKLFKTTN